MCTNGVLYHQVQYVTVECCITMLSMLEWIAVLPNYVCTVNSCVTKFSVLQWNVEKPVTYSSQVSIVGTAWKLYNLNK